MEIIKQHISWKVFNIILNSTEHKYDPVDGNAKK